MFTLEIIRTIVLMCQFLPSNDHSVSYKQTHQRCFQEVASCMKLNQHRAEPRETIATDCLIEQFVKVNK